MRNLLAIDFLDHLNGVTPQPSVRELYSAENLRMKYEILKWEVRQNPVRTNSPIPPPVRTLSLQVIFRALNTQWTAPTTFPATVALVFLPPCGGTRQTVQMHKNQSQRCLKVDFVVWSDAWMWFIRHVRCDLGSFGNYVISSPRVKRPPKPRPAPPQCLRSQH